MNPTKTTSGATKVLQECGIRSCRIKSLKLRRYISSSSLAETLLLDGWYLGDEGRSEMIKEFSDSGGVVAGRCRLALVLKTFFMIATPGSQTSRGPRRILDNTPSLPSRVQNSLSSPPPLSRGRVSLPGKDAGVAGHRAASALRGFRGDGVRLVSEVRLERVLQLAQGRHQRLQRKVSRAIGHVHAGHVLKLARLADVALGR